MLIPYSFVPYFILFSVFYFYLLELYSLRAYKYVDRMNGNHKKIIQKYLSSLDFWRYFPSLKLKKNLKSLTPINWCFHCLQRRTTLIPTPF